MLQGDKGHAPQLTGLACPRAYAPQREAPAVRSPYTTTKSSSHLLQPEKARMQQRKPSTAKYKQVIK